MNNLDSPADALLSVGEPLGPEMLGKTLLRFPGPCGLADLAKGTMRFLAPDSAPFLYMFKNRYADVQTGIDCFGTLAIFNPEQFSTVMVTEPEVLRIIGFDPKRIGVIFLGLNISAHSEQFFWVPPEFYEAYADWTQIPDRASMEAAFGPGYGARLKEMQHNVLAYMEEVAMIEASGTLPGKAWYKFSAEERAQILSSCGIPPRWAGVR